jgi:hypothetical protein
MSIARDHEAAHRAVNEIATAHGPESIPQVVLSWIDTMILHCGLEADGSAVGVRWQPEEGGPVTDADQTPAPVVWAGRLIAARVADDEDMYRAVFHSIDSDEDYARGVAAVLSTCGAMLRRVS